MANVFDKANQRGRPKQPQQWSRIMDLDDPKYQLDSVKSAEEEKKYKRINGYSIDVDIEN